jgi:D-psicose/D-tagatose/L-ribulose 3-epimerase
VDVAIEPLNRFETSFLNTVEQGCVLVEAIAGARIGLLLDTFHMNIEEQEIGSSIVRAARHIKHFHTCENNRGAPGSGHIDWRDVFTALKKIKYDRFAVIESYNPEIPQLAERVSVWRSFASNQDSLGRDGLTFLNETFAAV